MSDEQWEARLKRELKPGMLMTGAGGGMIELVKQATDRYGDQATHGPVWHAKQIFPCGPKTTAYVQYFDIAAQEAR